MSFLAPLFLLGLAALAVPVLVHLVQRQRREAVPFPSLMFLRRIPFRSVRRRKLQHLLLFALRALALALLALGFARPFLAGGGSAAAALRGGRERVILLDRSFSMAYGDRWGRARAAALRAVDGLAPGDRCGLILFSERAAGAVAPTQDREAVRAALAAAEPGAAGTRYGPALRLAREWLLAAERPRRELVLVSDFQRSGWEPDPDLSLPEGTALSFADLGEPDSPNAAITDLSFGRDYGSGRERVSALARLANQGPKALDLRLSLELEGRLVETKPVALAPRSAASVAFGPFAFPSGASRGVVRLETDPLAPDNLFHFVLAPGREVSVLLVEGEAPGSRPYLTRALAIGDRPRFRVEVRQARGLRPAELAGRAVVILEGAPADEAAAKALLAFVEGGGGLLVIPAEGGFRGTASSLLPGSLGPAVDRSSDLGASLGFLDYDHPVFALFRAPRSGDFSQARFLRYRSLRTEAGARVLARFDDGGATLVEQERGKGRLLAWTSALDGRASDLPLQPVFLPFLHQLVKHAGGHAETRPFLRVGEPLELREGGADAADEVLVSAPSGEKRRLGPSQRSLEPDQPGFYEIRELGGSGARTEIVAVNAAAGESDLRPLDKEELRGALTRTAAGAPARGGTPAGPEQSEKRQSLWWYLLLATLLLLVGEALLSNRLSRAAG